MSARDSSLNPSQGQVKSSQTNLADSINSAAEKDTRLKPWQSAHKDGQDTAQDGSQERGAKMNCKDEYWMAEGSVNASS